MAKHTLGWIGAGGRMGFAMAKRLLAAGHDVSVYNRTRSKVEPLAELGAKIVDSPRATARPRHRLHDGLGVRRLDRGVHSAPTACSTRAAARS